jgi:hypothetical protein
MRGDGREPIVRDDADLGAFVELLGELAARAGWKAARPLLPETEGKSENLD